eukprot:CAMPEP_0198282776 /NCGR_PEP_ID=MMETSP1449-20131203/2535_1 /TAXON_ID=420275 /ORGANISM="Attheya septentrionalis, Strain CCMP2084" /LENGTH=181 /DNA_ID=CAMNT_0043979171 /DNA_START=160 /DNA_END=702 /DNA_ORIENTATION=+
MIDTSYLQSNFGAAMAVVMTVYVLCVDNVKAFSQQSTSTFNDRSLAISSSASSLAKRMSFNTLTKGSFMKLPNVISSSSLIGNGHIFHSSTASLTSLSMAWSMPTQDTFSPAALRPFGSLYNELDPTPRAMVYDDYPLDYQFSSKFDDWDTSEPSQDVIDESDAGSHGNRYTGALRSAVAW